MSTFDTPRLGLFEQWRKTAFLIGGVIFVADVALVASNVATGTERFMTLGQAFVGAGWTAAFIGLLGFYPSLSDGSRWLVRIGAIFAVIGAITMALMAVVSLGYFTGILRGELADVTMFFLPGVFVGIILGFGPFGVVCLRSDVYSRNIGLLFLLLPVTFLFNLTSGIVGFGTLTTVLGVVVVLAVTMLAIGYLLQTGSALTESGQKETASGSSM